MLKEEGLGFPHGTDYNVTSRNVNPSVTSKLSFLRMAVPTRLSLSLNAALTVAALWRTKSILTVVLISANLAVDDPRRCLPMRWAV
jgi:hypothetical protein